MFIDIHTHAFHPKIAYKAVDHLNNFYNVACAGDGTIDHLLAREKHAGVDKCVVLCAATAPAQVIPANNYAMSLQKALPKSSASAPCTPVTPTGRRSSSGSRRPGCAA